MGSASLQQIQETGVYAALTALEGPERWVPLRLALACSVLFGTGARKASQRRTASEWLDDA